jgi:hypothetical protein
MGALYHLLQNRIYCGEIVHKDKSYPGEHQAIVDEGLWDDVQTILASNRRCEGVERSLLQPARPEQQFRLPVRPDGIGKEPASWHLSRVSGDVMRIEREQLPITPK